MTGLICDVAGEWRGKHIPPLMGRYLHASPTTDLLLRIGVMGGDGNGGAVMRRDTHHSQQLEKTTAAATAIKKGTEAKHITTTDTHRNYRETTSTATSPH